MRTGDALTGALRYLFGYDPAGLLMSVTDAIGNVTTVARDSGGKPTAIVSPFGQTTTLSLFRSAHRSQRSKLYI